MSQVNLLPPEILQRQTIRRRTILVGAVGAAVVLLILGFYLLQNTREASVNDQIAAQEATNTGLQGDIQSLQPYATLQSDAQAQKQLLDAAFANEISFSGLLMDVSRVIPSDAALDSLSFTETAGTTGATTTSTTTTTSGTAAPTFVGTMTASGKGASAETLATWLTRLESVKGWVNPWITSYTKGENPTAYTFSSGVDLTADVITPRGKAGTDAGG